VVDTYTITPEFGGNGDGLLKVFSGKDLLSQRDVCVWVWKRLALSGVKWNAVQSFLIMEECLRYSFIIAIISWVTNYSLILARKLRANMGDNKIAMATSRTSVSAKMVACITSSPLASPFT